MLSLIPDINLVPPHKGHNLPVIFLYTHVVSIGEIWFNTFAKIGKRTIYNERQNIVMFRNI